MEENKNLVRIAYVKADDAFEVRISTDGGDEWDMLIHCPCCRSVGQREDDEPMYVHVDLLQELKKALAFGYEAVY